jgi:hypothetical protein
MIESFYSRARRGSRRIDGYVTVSSTRLADKMAGQETANVTARSVCKIGLGKFSDAFGFVCYFCG